MLWVDHLSSVSDVEVPPWVIETRVPNKEAFKLAGVGLPDVPHTHTITDPAHLTQK